MNALDIRELFYLWQLAGGDSQSELRKHGLVVNMPPVLNLPNLIVSRRPSPSGGGLPQHQAVGQVKDRSSLYDPSVVTLDLTNLASCLQSLSIDEIYPVLSTTTTKVNTEVKQKSTSMYLLVVRLFFAHFFKSFADPKVLKS